MEECALSESQLAGTREGKESLQAYIGWFKESNSSVSVCLYDLELNSHNQKHESLGDLCVRK